MAIKYGRPIESRVRVVPVEGHERSAPSLDLTTRPRRNRRTDAIRRLVRETSACVRSACPMLVPKRSVWIRIATSLRTSFSPVRSEKLWSASARRMPARISRFTRLSSLHSIGCVVCNSRATVRIA